MRARTRIGQVSRAACACASALRVGVGHGGTKRPRSGVASDKVKEERHGRDVGERGRNTSGEALLEGGYDGSWRYAPRAVMLLGHHRTISEATSLRRNSRHVSRYINASASAE